MKHATQKAQLRQLCQSALAAFDANALAVQPQVLGPSPEDLERLRLLLKIKGQLVVLSQPYLESSPDVDRSAP